MLAEPTAAGVVCRPCCTRRNKGEVDPDGWARGDGETQKKGCDSKFENKVFPMSKNRQNLT